MVEANAEVCAMELNMVVETTSTVASTVTTESGAVVAETETSEKK